MIIEKLKVDKVEYNGKYTDIILRSETDNVRLYLSGNEAGNFLTDKEYTLTLDDRTKSKDARGYAWGLLTQIGNLLQASKEEIYTICLKRYSQGEIYTFTNDEWKEKETEFKHFEILNRQILENTPIVIVQRWKGISEMNAYELNIFIEGVKSECKELGIDTMTPSERSLISNDT